MLRLGAILFVFSAFYTIVIGAPLTRGNLLVGRIGNGAMIGIGPSENVYVLEVDPSTGETVQTFDLGCVINSNFASQMGNIAFDADGTAAAIPCISGEPSQTTAPPDGAERKIAEISMNGDITYTKITADGSQPYSAMVSSEKIYWGGTNKDFFYSLRGSSGDYPFVKDLFAFTTNEPLTLIDMQVYNGSFYLGTFPLTQYHISKLDGSPPTEADTVPSVVVDVTGFPSFSYSVRHMFVFSDTEFYGTEGIADHALYKIYKDSEGLWKSYFIALSDAAAGVTAMDVDGVRKVYVVTHDLKLSVLNDTGSEFTEPTMIKSSAGEPPASNMIFTDVIVIPPAATCEDNLINQDETDVDCGGDVCTRKCSANRRCLSPDDCESSVCSAQFTCAAPTCDDSTKNQDESDWDCGGNNCARCADSRACNSDADCASKYCTSEKVCATPTCSDLVKNQNETDIDCGGVACGATCDEGDACQADTDCASNNCSELVCAAPILSPVSDAPESVSPGTSSPSNSPVGNQTPTPGKVNSGVRIVAKLIAVTCVALLV